MSREIKAYLRLEAIVAAAFNFLINGMIGALVYHKVDRVPADTIAIDLTLTCLLTFTLSLFFCRASLRRTKTEGIFAAQNPLLQCLGRLFRRPLLFGVTLGFFTAMVLSAPAALALALLGIPAIPFALYIALKTIFSALLGAGVTLIELYAGICRVE